MKKTFVIMWKYVAQDYTEVSRVFICAAENGQQAVTIVKSMNNWNDDKENNSSFHGFIVDGFNGYTEVGTIGDVIE